MMPFAPYASAVKACHRSCASDGSYCATTPPTTPNGIGTTRIATQKGMLAPRAARRTVARLATKPALEMLPKRPSGSGWKKG